MKSVFIIEDEEIEREALIKTINDRYKDSLRVCGSADNGELGLSRISVLNPNLIFLDIHLENMSGLDVASRIRQKGLKSSIIIVTAYPNFNYAQNAIRLQVADYLLKPYSIKTLDTAIRRVSNSYKTDTISNTAEIYQTPVEKAKEYIRQFSIKELFLDDIARESGLSKYQLSRQFNKDTGMGIREFQHRCRIHIVQSLLQKGMNITEASLSAGYSDPNYFSRIVRKYTGQTASTLRKSN